jgi:hypothetical protein
VEASLLEQARLTDGQVADCLHLLAAMAHRQWAQWQSYLGPLLERSGYDALNALCEDTLPVELERLLTSQASAPVKLVGRVVRAYAYEPSYAELLNNKRGLFRRWARHVANTEPTDAPANLERWKLQCRTPFLWLSRRQQESDYLQGVHDLVAVAKVGGLVLPDPLPAVEPKTDKELGRQQAWHAFGFHGLYVLSEPEFTRACQACHKSAKFYPGDW